MSQCPGRGRRGVGSSGNGEQRRQNLRATQTGLVDLEMPIDASNVKLVTPSGKPTRVNYRDENGVSKRYSNKFDEVID